jgi:hypothetical protein
MKTIISIIIISIILWLLYDNFGHYTKPAYECSDHYGTVVLAFRPNKYGIIVPEKRIGIDYILYDQERVIMNENTSPRLGSRVTFNYRKKEPSSKFNRNWQEMEGKKTYVVDCLKRVRPKRNPR